MASADTGGAFVYCRAELAVMDGPSSPGAPLSVLAFAGPYASASQQQGVLVSLACGMPRSIAEAKVC